MNSWWPGGRRGFGAITPGSLFLFKLHFPAHTIHLTIDPDHRVVVSRRIREEFENGREYYRLDDQRLANHPHRDARPNRAFLTWHKEEGAAHECRRT